MYGTLSPQISSSFHPLPQALLAGWGIAVARVFFRMLLFFPSILSLRMVCILPHSNPLPYTNVLFPWEQFPLLWANHSPFFRNCLWQQ